MMTALHKVAVFSRYVSTVCPSCRGPKNRAHWLCIDCRAIAGSHANATPEFQRLDIACAEHVNAAEAYIAKAKAVRGVA